MSQGRGALDRLTRRVYGGLARGAPPASRIMIVVHFSSQQPGIYEVSFQGLRQIFSRRQLFELSDKMATKVSMSFTLMQLMHLQRRLWINGELCQNPD
jgi:hypothetical protein